MMKVKRFSFLTNDSGKIQQGENNKKTSIPMTFKIKEIGSDNNGKFAIITAKNDITGELIEKKMYENKTYDSEKDFILKKKKND